MSRTAPRLGALSLCALAAGLGLALLVLSVPRAAVGQEDPFEGAYFRPLEGDRPLGGASAILDPQEGRFLPFGGEAAPFEVPESARQLALLPPPGAWSDLTAEGEAPYARLPARGIVGGAAVLDDQEGLMVAHCDCGAGSTFLLDLAEDAWSPAPGDADLPYVNGLRAYDPVEDRLLLWGGDYRGLDAPTNQGWAYDLSAVRSGWRALPPAPFTHTFQAADVDRASGQLLAFGGRDERGAAVGTLWRLDLARADEAGAWVALSPSGEGPGPRMGASLTFAGDSGMAVLFGGYDPETAADVADHWILDHRDPEAPRWRRLEVPGTPAPRSAQAAAWDEERQDVVLYGGVGAAGGRATYLGDAHALDLFPASPPTPTPDGPTPTPTPTPTEGTGGAPIYLPLTFREHVLP